jgi:hypothetical protein
MDNQPITDICEWCGNPIEPPDSAVDMVECVPVRAMGTATEYLPGLGVKFHSWCVQQQIGDKLYRPAA